MKEYYENRPMTPTQRKTLDFIRHYRQQYGYSPSLTEIASGLGISAKSSVHRHVQALAEAGYLLLQEGKKRGIRLVEAIDDTPSLPLLGRIAAGLPIEAIPDQEILNLSEFLLGPDRFALLVQGDSMIEDGILDGDTVIIKRQATAHNGNVVVALINNEEATLKHIKHRTDGHIELIAANSAIAPMIYPADEVAIQGVLVGQMRRYG